MFQYCDESDRKIFYKILDQHSSADTDQPLEETTLASQPLEEALPSPLLPVLAGPSGREQPAAEAASAEAESMETLTSFDVASGEVEKGDENEDKDKWLDEMDDTL